LENAALQHFVQNLIRTSEELREGIGFGRIIEAATGCKVIPITSSTQDKKLLEKLKEAFNLVVNTCNAEGGVRPKSGRVNEVGSTLEAYVKEAINLQEGLICTEPKTLTGAIQRAGYPNLEVIDEYGRSTYLEIKSFDKQKATSSNFRTFYYEPRTKTSKVTKDARHLLIAFPHLGGKGPRWKLAGWLVVDMSNIKVRLKAEFQSSNRWMYRKENILDASHFHRGRRS